MGMLSSEIGLPQRDKNGVRWPARVAFNRAIPGPTRSAAPSPFPGSEISSPRIVGPAAVRVEIVKMLMQTARQKPGDYVEIFVVMRGEPAGVALGFPQYRSIRAAAALGLISSSAGICMVDENRRTSRDGLQPTGLVLF